MSGELPEKIDRYQVKGIIGQGGMATVYRAYDPRFERDVAIKLMPKAFLYEPDFRTRFIREAKTIALLEHPSIVPVYDFGEDHGQPYLVMRLMPGGSLSDKLENGPLPMNEVLKIMERIGSALDEAHRRNIVHRDLKPANILFDQYGNAYLGDFGIVRLAEGGGTSLTGTGTIGTPGYMSPEQIQGHQLDGRADIYALGVMLFEMITGERPYKADSAPMMIVKQMTEAIPKIQSIKPDLPRSYDAVLERATARNREARPRSATDLTNMLAAASKDPHYVPPASAVPVAPPSGGTQRMPAPRGAFVPDPDDQTQVMPTGKQHRPASSGSGSRWLIIALVLLLIIVVAAAALLLSNREEPGTTVMVITTTAEATTTPDAAATEAALALLNQPTETATLEPTATATDTPEPTATLEPTTTLTPTNVITATASNAAALFTTPETDAEGMCVFIDVGETVDEVLGRSANGSWLLVSFDETIGWVTASFFEVTGTVSELPVTEYVAEVPADCDSSATTGTPRPNSTSSTAGGTAFFNTSGATPATTGNGQWGVDFTVRVPAGGTYSFQVGQFSTTSFFQSSDGSQDTFLVSVRGIGCDATLATDLFVTENGQRLTVVNEQTGETNSALFFARPQNC